ncbi:hypothetical protein BGZ76_006149, partial [Entomortierella beljakovae]
EKGKYLLEKGDAELKKSKIGNAISYYGQAIKYCPDEAQERLAKTSRYQLADTASDESTQIPGTPHEKRDEPKQFQLTRPYFPEHLVSSGILFTPIHSPATLSQELINYTVHDAPSTLVLANMFRYASEEEKKSINETIDQIIQRYGENSISKESIQELTVLASIPDQRIFIAIVTQFLKVEMNSPTFPELTIHGLAVILTSAPEEIDLKERQGLVSDIIGRLQFRLEKTRIENNTEELLPLLRALSALFDAMLCRKMKHLCRQDVYNPINDRLSELASYDGVDPEVSFLAHYAIQSLAYIGNDESLSMSIFRRGRLAIGIIDDIKSAVLSFNIGVFESVYDKIMSMSDFTIKMEWYQGLLFLDCLLARDDFMNFEKFITESNLNSNENFLQGVCLRVEQLALLHSNQHVALGAQTLLQDLALYPTEKVKVTARMILNRLSITSNKLSSSLATIDPSISESTSGLQQQASTLILAPVWDKSWYSNNNSHLLKAVQDASKRELNISNLDKITPKPSTMSEVSKALMEHYSSQLTIQRVSGKPLDLKYCYINLAIVEASGQRKQDEEELKKQQEKFIRMPSFEN